MMYDKSTDGCTGSKLAIKLFPSTKRFFDSIYHLCVDHDFYYRNQTVLNKLSSDLWLMFDIFNVGYQKDLAFSLIVYIFFGVFVFIILSTFGWIAWLLNRFKKYGDVDD